MRSAEELRARVGRELEALAQRADPIVLHMPRLDAWMILAELQLVLRHPQNTGLCAAAARRLVNVLKAQVATTPGLQALADAGDDPRCDVE